MVGLLSSLPGGPRKQEDHDYVGHEPGSSMLVEVLGGGPTSTSRLTGAPAGGRTLRVHDARREDGLPPYTGPRGGL